jgi:dihydroxy-acid dehydratase
MAKERLTPDKILTPAAFTNALRTVLAAGGSTNALIHLTAMAGRLGIGVDLAGFDRIARETPVLIDLKPTGQGYMEDLYKAGGLVPMLRELAPMLDLDCMTVTGRTLGENIAAAPPSWKQDVIRPMSNPIYSGGAMAVLRGNLAPGGAIIKQAAAQQSLLQHTGRAVVFSSLADLAARMDDPNLDVAADDVIVLQNAGPKGAPGMPEAGYVPIPKKLLQQGVKDMVRISDARMSGTAFGTIVLHISPESAVGGPLGLVRNGDRIQLDTAGRQINLLVDDKELAARRKALPAAPSGEGRRGYERLYFETVTQAEQGCDFDFSIPKITRMIP